MRLHGWGEDATDRGPFVYSIKYRIARAVMRHRTLVAWLFVLVTAFFAVGMRHVELRTKGNEA